MNIAASLGRKENNMIAVLAVAFGVAFVAPEFVTTYSQQYIEQESGEKRQLEKRVAELQAEIDGIEDRKVILGRYVRRYRSLIERKIVRAPGKVSLVRQMKQINDEGKYKSVAFNFLDPIVIDPTETQYTADSTVEVEVSPLVLEMGMLHDMDMFMFLEELSERIPNVSFPVQCSMTSMETEFVVADRENMRATCQVNWYSVKDPESTQPIEEEDDLPPPATPEEEGEAAAAS